MISIVMKVAATTLHLATNVIVFQNSPSPTLQTLTNNINSSGHFSFQITEKSICVNRAFSSHSDTTRLMLIPPTAFELSNKFLSDLEEITASTWTLRQVDVVLSNALGVHLSAFISNVYNLTYEIGNRNEEGYGLDIKERLISIRGSRARGMWWALRKLLQQL
ncbi:hypothetical protein EJ08DRAFT_69612 [Tothia fuscella]|uniref:Uncharacterized protein n=1 Tax=Tothia fuscella TaxID=1048955 RepID=A0A9P4TSB6_9PEZI|nr:hypothetical protein EJ08DRAFT_69612 [Tothia fuscella]